jgi:hypothetical protein
LRPGTRQAPAPACPPRRPPMLRHATPAITAQLDPMRSASATPSATLPASSSAPPPGPGHRSRWPSARSRPGCAPPAARAAVPPELVAQAVRAAAALGWAGGAGREPGPGGGPRAHARAGRGHGAHPPGRSDRANSHAAGWGQGPLGAGRAPILTTGRVWCGPGQEAYARPCPSPRWPGVIHRPCRAGLSPRLDWLSSRA